MSSEQEVERFEFDTSNCDSGAFCRAQMLQCADGDYVTFDAYDALRTQLAAVSAARDAGQSLYRRAVNEANGLTNYIEDRPELTRAERALEKIQRDARALPRPDAARGGEL